MNNCKKQSISEMNSKADTKCNKAAFQMKQQQKVLEHQALLNSYLVQLIWYRVYIEALIHIQMLSLFLFSSLFSESHVQINLSDFILFHVQLFFSSSSIIMSELLEIQHIDSFIKKLYVDQFLKIYVNQHVKIYVSFTLSHVWLIFSLLILKLILFLYIRSFMKSVSFHDIEFNNQFSNYNQQKLYFLSSSLFFMSQFYIEFNAEVYIKIHIKFHIKIYMKIYIKQSSKIYINQHAEIYVSFILSCA